MGLVIGCKVAFRRMDGLVRLAFRKASGRMTGEAWGFVMPSDLCCSARVRVRILVLLRVRVYRAAACWDTSSVLLSELPESEPELHA